MAGKWIGYFFNETDLEGSELLLALAIADHADADGIAFPGYDLLARKIRLGKRRTRDLVKALRDHKYVEIVRRPGRGNKTQFQLKRGQRAAPFEDDKRGNPVHEKGAIWCTEKGQSGARHIKEEPFKETNMNRQQKPRELETWLSAIAPSLGANNARDLADFKKWERVCTAAIASGFGIPAMLQAIRELKADCQGKTQFFTPDGVLKKLQLGSVATSPAEPTLQERRAERDESTFLIQPPATLND